jgi:hypothetical protein
LRILTFPFHAGYQTELFKLDHEFIIIDGYADIWWDKKPFNTPPEEQDIQFNPRPTPDNVKLFPFLKAFDGDPLPKADLLILPTAEHIDWMRGSKLWEIPHINCHATMFPLPWYIKDLEEPIYHTAGTPHPLREGDKFIPHGHDHNEFYNEGKIPKSGIIHPINRFEEIGNPVTGYENRDALRLLPETLTVGNNPKWEKRPDTKTKNPDYETYKVILQIADMGLQLSKYKARSFTTPEMMLSEVVPITMNEGNIFPKGMKTFIKNKVNGYIVNSAYGFKMAYNKFQNLPPLVKRTMRENARDTVIKHQSLEAFHENWSIAIEDAIN